MAISVDKIIIYKHFKKTVHTLFSQSFSKMFRRVKKLIQWLGIFNVILNQNFFGIKINIWYFDQIL